MKSLFLYDFVGLYLAILCNPYYGYPIAYGVQNPFKIRRIFYLWY